MFPIPYETWAGLAPVYMELGHSGLSVEEEILARMKAGRYEEALELILRGWRVKVFHLACALLDDRADAEEAAQEAFLRIWKGLPGFRGQSSLSTWIYAVTRNTCLSYRQTKRRPASLPLDEEPVRAAVEAWHAARQPKESRMDLLRLLPQLPEQHRQVLTLYYLEGKSYDEVARMLQAPMGTVKTWLNRGRKELARLAGAMLMKG